ncbi:MAG: hypothetical protein AVDCRST_MAG56-5578 [uncultured Cytophagales bacterium]|uniref:Uncharacterized protein n=1 Tax=uncultured Cytophagales bacterium TaxID=158755 RepID=A0A6J4KD70_9SPHI|nr:MAG: hypothetical protein AVDCRST_MAG56-5578 [uncultured Cytophagales bacterium]
MGVNTQINAALPGKVSRLHQLLRLLRSPGKDIPHGKK